MIRGSPSIHQEASEDCSEGTAKVIRRAVQRDRSRTSISVDFKKCMLLRSLS